MSIDIEGIRQRHAARDQGGPIVARHGDIGALLAEVDRLTVELAETREAYDALCRSVGQRAVEGVRHGDERARAALNSPRITLADARREARQ